MRRKRRVTWAQQHEAWLNTPAGEFDNANQDFGRSIALGPICADEIRARAERAIRIGEKHGFDVSGIRACLAHVEAKWAAR